MQPIVNVFLGQIVEAAKSADMLSQKDDRWLFLFSLVLLLGSTGWMLRYTLMANKELQTKSDNCSKEYSTSLAAIIEKGHVVHQEFALKVYENTRALEANTRVLSSIERKTTSLSGIHIPGKPTS